MSYQSFEVYVQSEHHRCILLAQSLHELCFERRRCTPELLRVLRHLDFLNLLRNKVFGFVICKEDFKLIIVDFFQVEGVDIFYQIGAEERKLRVEATSVGDLHLEVEVGANDGVEGGAEVGEEVERGQEQGEGDGQEEAAAKGFVEDADGLASLALSVLVVSAPEDVYLVVEIDKLEPLVDI